MGGYASLLGVQPGLYVPETLSDDVAFRGGKVAAVREGLGQEILVDDFADLVVHQGAAESRIGGLSQITLFGSVNSYADPQTNGECYERRVVAELRRWLLERRPDWRDAAGHRIRIEAINH